MGRTTSHTVSKLKGTLSKRLSMMKISIWQQFSSNHSASFTVVGRFATEDAARTAADTLLNILQRLSDWHEIEENEIWYEEQEASNRPSLTPVELDIQQEYNLEWERSKRGVDWYQHLSGAVVQLSHDVMFSVEETWSDPRTVSELFAKFGGQTYEDVQAHQRFTTITVQLTCDFNDEAGISRVKEEIALWKQISDGDNPPWTYRTDYQYAKVSDISQGGNRLTLRLTEGVTSLPALLLWLEMLDAYNIRYTFEMVHHADFN